MNMKALIILEMIAVLSAYLLAFVGLPAWVLKKRLQARPLGERFLICLVIGNTVIINLVFALNFLKIGNSVTLYISVILILILAHRHYNREEFKNFGRRVKNNLIDLSKGTRTFRQLVSGSAKKGRPARKAGRSWLAENLFYVLVLGAILAFILYILGSEFTAQFGYKVSDNAVHNYWINDMIMKNRPFTEGVYPFGYHCVIYFLAVFFHIPVFVILSVFGFVTSFLLLCSLIAIVSLVGRNRYSVLTGLCGLGVFSLHCADGIYRYYAGIPQEYGQIFILPTVYFLLQLIDEFSKKPEGRIQKKTVAKRLKKDKGEKRDEEKRLAGARRGILSFFRRLGSRLSGWARYQSPTFILVVFSAALVINIHFYNIFIFMTFAVGILIAWFPFIFRPACLKKIFATAFLALFIAALPMGIGLTTGVGFQGSLNWGFQVINGTAPEPGSATTTDQTSSDDGGNSGTTTDQKVTDDGESSGDNDEKTDGDNAQGSDESRLEQGSTGVVAAAGAAGAGKAESLSFREKAAAFGTRLKETGAAIHSDFRGKIITYYRPFCLDEKRLGKEGVEITIKILLLLPVALLCLSLILLAEPRKDGKKQLNLRASITVSVAMMIMIVMLVAKALGLPVLIQDYRMGTYLVYFYALTLGLTVDLFVSLLCFFFRKKRLRNTVSLAVCLLTIYGGISFFGLQKPMYYDAMTYNGNITCLTNIVMHNPRKSYTIVSATEEQHMMEQYGWHTEISDFLYDMEEYPVIKNYTITNTVMNERAVIPTRRVYFFIEKYPIWYDTPVDTEAIQTVDSSYAEMDLPTLGDPNVYKGQNRFVEMSRIYYWAQKFKSLYPDSIRTYYEDDRFVCYEVDQDAENYINFAIDYGYNKMTPERVQKAQDRLTEFQKAWEESEEDAK